MLFFRNKEFKRRVKFFDESREYILKSLTLKRTMYNNRMVDR